MKHSNFEDKFWEKDVWHDFEEVSILQGGLTSTLLLNSQSVWAEEDLDDLEFIFKIFISLIKLLPSSASTQLNSTSTQLRLR